MPIGGSIDARAAPARSRPATSVPFLLVDQAEQRLTSKVPAQVVAKQGCHALIVVGADARHMWGQDHVRKVEVRAVWRQRSLCEDVQRGTGDPALAEAAEQGG